jgi:hypothetical protein
VFGFFIIINNNNGRQQRMGRKLETQKEFEKNFIKKNILFRETKLAGTTTQLFHH